MKKLAFVFLSLFFLFTFCSCSQQNSDPVLESLPEYKSSEHYSSGGFQDYTDFAKYSYESIDVQDIEKSKYFSPVTPDDATEILLHINNFEQWVETSGGDLKENYDFDKNIISDGDFFYIETKAVEPVGKEAYGKYDNYSVYYFDIDTNVLYYFHNNI
jgi:hypothetical protein